MAKKLVHEESPSPKAQTIDLDKPLPVLPLRDSIVLPGTSMRILVGREVSFEAMRAAQTPEFDSTLLLVMQRDPNEDDVTPKLLFDVGVVSRIVSFTLLPNGFQKVLFEGLFAADVTELKFASKKTHLTARVSPRDFHFEAGEAAKERAQDILDRFRSYATRMDLPSDLLDSLNSADVPLQTYFGMVPFLRLPLEEKQNLLEQTSLEGVAGKVEEALLALEEVERLARRVKTEVHRKTQQSQRDWLISEQIRMLQGELSYDDSGNDVDALLEKLRAKKFSKEIQEKLEEECSRLRMMSVASPEYALIRNYLDCFLTLPYGVYSETDLNLRQVKKVLDSRHYGLEKVKERILEYVAVLRLTGTEKRAPVLCLVGPPGVGKTTLASSVAESIGRPFVRVTLGGVRDEAEVRGHRRAYIGSMPGRFVQALRRAKCMNPVILLDEIDKMASDFRGDPASALLELLDPEQNQFFSDHFMEVGLDFSRVLFIATANSERDIPPALFDRLEVLRLPGYYKFEKVLIAQKHLLPQIAERCGLELEKDVSISAELVEKVISDYTREAGVRELDRLLEKVARARAKEIVIGKKADSVVDEKRLLSYLGVPRFTNNRLPEPGFPGRITGLAWTSVGGEILLIECMLLSGRGKVNVTGQLGDVMKESLQIAISLVRARLRRYGIDPEIVRKTDIHLHVPEGAVPKDGPSAGVAMTLAVLSAFTKIPVPPDIAFTGEVDLSGSILPIGGLNEKALAAKEAGVKTIYVPNDNSKDVSELPAPAKKGLKILLKKHIDEVIKELFPLPQKG